MRTINLVITVLIFMIFNTLLPVKAASKYLPLELVSGNNPGLELQLHENSFTLNLAKTANMRVRVKVNELYSTTESTGSFKISLFDIVGGVREFISTQSLSIQRGAKKNRILSINAGHFNDVSKEVEFDLFDTENNLVNTYRATINATNVFSQTSSGSGVDFSAACTPGTVDECHLDAFFNRVNFKVQRQRQASTRIMKDENGIYTVTIPVPRSGFNFLKGNRAKSLKVGTGTGGGGITAFGDTIDATAVRIGPNSDDNTVLSYDSTNNQLEIGFSTTPEKTMVVGDNGKVGIGVDPPSAYLHVRNGTTTMPSIMINSGPLLTTLLNGALEFDGNNLFFTANGVRNALTGGGGGGTAGAQGAQGVQGVQGEKGDKGDKGDPGPAGSLTANNGGTLNGDVLVKGDLTVTGTVTATKYNGPTPVATAAVDIDGSTNLDVTNLNTVVISDSNTVNATVEDLTTMTGGTLGQKIQLILASDMNIIVNTSHATDTIQWGSGAVAGPRPQKTRNIFEFIYDGNAWYLLDRFLP